MQKNQMTSQSISLLTEIKRAQSGKAGAGTSEINSHRKTVATLTSNSELEYCSLINRITAAVETGGVQAGTDFLPEMFATADGFEKFLNELLNELDISYKRSVESWGHSFKNILDATDEIRQANESVN